MDAIKQEIKETQRELSKVQAKLISLEEEGKYGFPEYNVLSDKEIELDNHIVDLYAELDCA